MSFQSKNFSVLAYSNGFTLWHYTTKDNNKDVFTNGYFNDGADMLRTGDMIMMNLNTDGESEAALALCSISDGKTAKMSKFKVGV